MHDLPRHRLCELIERYGPGVCDDLRRCEALVRDYCGEHKREAFVLLSALREQVIADLRAGHGRQPAFATIARLAQRLHDQLGIVVESARWAVESWALALGLVTVEELEPPTSTAPAFTLPPVTQTVIVSPVGQADHRSIAEALAGAGPGTRIIVRPGFYRESLVLTKAVALVGDGPAEGIILESEKGNCIRVQDGEAHVRGLTLACRTAAAGKRFAAVDVSQGRLLVEDCDITADSLSGVLVHGPAARALLRRCRIHDSQECGVFVLENADVTLEECVLARNGFSGIEARRATVLMRRCEISQQPRDGGVTLRDNAQAVIEECDIHDNAGAGLTVTLGSRARVKATRFHDGKEAGLRFHEHGQGTVEECDIHGHAQAGVIVQQGSTPTLRRCKVHDQANHYGIQVRERGKGRFEECDVYGNGLAGVGISQESQPLVRSCKIHHHAKHNGVHVFDKGQGTLEDCDIFENAYAGVEVSQGGCTIIRRCRIQRNGSYAVRICLKSSAEVEDCDLADNAIVALNVDPDCTVNARDNRE